MSLRAAQTWGALPRPPVRLGPYKDGNEEETEEEQPASMEPAAAPRPAAPAARARPQSRRLPKRTIWDASRVRAPAGRILVLGILSTMMGVFGPALMTFIGTVPLMPLAGVLPSYGSIYAVMHWGATFALALVADWSRAVPPHVLMAGLWAGAFALDAWALANMGWWIVYYYLGLLTPEAAAHGSLYGTLVVALFTLVLLMFDAVVLSSFAQIVMTVVDHRNRALVAAAGGEDEGEEEED